MKRVFSTVAALGLVAGMATAANALDFSVTGNYWAAGIYMSDAQGNGLGVNNFRVSTATDALSGDDPLNGGDINTTNTLGLANFPSEAQGDDIGSDAYYAHEFRILPKLVVNDKVTVFGDVRLIDTQIWGSQDDTPGQAGMTTGGNNNGHGFDMNQLYMDYLSPVGKVRVGRAPAGAWGHNFLNHTGPADRIMWWPSFVPAPWGVVTLIQKNVDGDAVSGVWSMAADTNLGVPNTIISDDADNDTYLLGVTYDTAPIKFQIGYFLNDFANNGDAQVVASAYDRLYHRLDGSANFVFGNYYLDTELVYDFGDWQDFDSNNQNDSDVSSWGFIADAGGNFGPLRTGLMYFYASGDDPDDNDQESIMATTVGSLGKDFEPWYILTGSETGMAVRDHQGARADMVAAGMHSIGIYGDYQFDSRLSFHGAIAGAWADEPDAPFAHVTGGTLLSDNDNNLVAQDTANTDFDSRDSSYGWEIDLGAAYKLLDNLTYSIHFAYFDAGDFFAVQQWNTGVDVDGDTVADSVLLGTDDTNNVYQLIHKISLTF